MHAQGGMARIIEAVDQLEWQGVKVGEPVDQRSGATRHGFERRGSGTVIGLTSDIAGEAVGTVRNALGALKARAGGRNEPGRQGGRPARYGIALDHDGIDSRLLCRKRAANSSSASSDNQQRHPRVPFRDGIKTDCTHEAIIPTQMRWTMAGLSAAGRSLRSYDICTWLNARRGVHLQDLTFEAVGIKIEWLT